MESRMKFVGLMLAGMAAALAVPAAAETQSKQVFAHKAWTVEVVAFDEGTTSCVASVSDPGESFSIWADQQNPVKLQFYSTAWQFDGGTANLQLRIDRRPIWNLTNAELYQNSVLFNLPDSQAGTNFLLEVARGNVLYLATESGEGVQSYSLAGSKASMGALIDCVNALGIGGNPANPFK